MPIHLFGKNTNPTSDFVTVVSGLPRSGTSMMMQILKAGGMEIMTDQERIADEDNPRGYYEYERVKKLKEGDVAWVKDARGKVVKIISALLDHLPSQYHYKVIFMHRHMDEILASQNQMLIRRAESKNKVDDGTMSELFQKHLTYIEAWLEKQSNFEVIYVHYDELLKNPQLDIEKIVKFLGLPLNTPDMIIAPDLNLYRQRH
jgi:hypothetical protein